jgi:hypothetical protein
MRPGWPVAVAFAATAILAQPASAVELPLSPAGREAAVEAGRRMANAEGGYAIRDYVLFETADALVVRPGEGEIYAVTLRTPFERVRWTTYLQARQGRPAAEEADARSVQTVDVIVHARSADGRGHDVLDRMQLPALTLASGIRLEPLAVERGRPFRGSQWVVGDDGQARPQERWLGTIACRFRLQAADAGPSSFEITDGTGRRYRVEVDLSAFR